MSASTRRAFLSTGIAAATAVVGAAQSTPSLEQQLAPPTTKVDAVIDSDTYNEIDDQFAVAYALRSPERLNVLSVYAAPYLNDRSTSAGDGMRKSHEEIVRILKRLNVASDGFALAGSPNFMTAASKPVDSPAARDLIQKAAAKRTGPLYVLTIGAPTNVSSAILMEPKIKDQIVVVWLGGQPFNWSTAREFNLQQDLHASRVLYDSGVPLVNIPTKNVSEHLRTTTFEVDHFLKGKSPIADYLASEFTTFMKSHSKQPGFSASKVIWDISAVAWMIDPKWVPSSVVPSPVLTDDMKYQTTASGRHMVRVATDCNRDAIFNDLFTKLARS
jgi:inosine-uridine nucleoside N-ribohydrolase